MNTSDEFRRAPLLDGGSALRELGAHRCAVPRPRETFARPQMPHAFAPRPEKAVPARAARYPSGSAACGYLLLLLPSLAAACTSRAVDEGMAVHPGGDGVTATEHFTADDYSDSPADERPQQDITTSSSATPEPILAAGCTPREVDDGITVRPGADVVTAIERFTVDDSNSSPADGHPPQTITTAPEPGGLSPVTPELTLASSYVQNTLRRTPGFVAALLLNGQHGEVALYSQWHAEGPAPLALPAAWSVAPALVGSRAKLVDGRTYVVDFTAPGDSARFTPSTPAHAHFGLFTMKPDDQERLLELARTSAPSSIGTPGLLAINFHRSLDGRQVVNLGAWTDFDGFAELLKRPGFKEGEPYWEGVAGFQNIFFDVAAVVTAP